MISNKVRTKLDTFLDKISPLTALTPYYTLDFSWTSIGFFDVLTMPLRGNKNLDEFSSKVISATASYLAVIAHDCWLQFGVEVVVDEQTEGVVIAARNGAGIPENEEVVLHIERELKKIIAEFPYPFPVFSDFNREIAFYMNQLNSFAIGVVTGLTPYIEGEWANLKAVDVKENIEKVVRHLAKGAAEYYGKVFPDEPLGQVTELYLNSLIFPPILFSEDYPARRAVMGILDFCVEYKVSKQSLLKLSMNLSKLPDEVMSFAGIAITIALLDKENIEIKAITETKGLFLATVRAATYDVVEHFNLHKDWLEQDEYTQEVKDTITKEINLGFFPWLKFSKEKIFTADKDKKLRDLIIVVKDFDLNKIITQADSIIELDPNEIEARVQRIYSEVIRRDMNTANVEISKLITEPEAENYASVYNLNGMIQLINKDFDKAISSFRQGQNMAINDINQSIEISNNLAWTLMTKGEYQDALDILELALQRKPKSLITLLNKMACLLQLNKIPLANKLLPELLTLAPFESRSMSTALELKVFNQIP